MSHILYQPSSRPLGMELRLTDVPTNLSARALKAALVDQYFKEIDYDFLVVLETSSEELFWQQFDKLKEKRGITARVIIPNYFDDHNVGKALIDRAISLRCGKTSFKVLVTKVQNSETTNQKYSELRKTKVDVGEAVGIQDGTIGSVRRVSCGMFGQGSQFESHYTWTCDKEHTFKNFSYFGDVWPKKFRVCLTESDSGEPMKWEWMDLQEPNIQGIVFESPKSTDQEYHVVYFVLDKPPQFYRRSAAVHPRSSINSAEDIKDSEIHQFSNDEMRLDHFRIPYPSMPQLLEDDRLGVPLVIQYSRVFRVEYSRIQTFRLKTLEPRLGSTKRETLFSFEYAGIEASTRPMSDITEVVNWNLEQIQNLFRPQGFSLCNTAILKLFYNCNLSMTSYESASLFAMLNSNEFHWATQHIRIFTETMDFIAERINKTQVRSLQRLYRRLPQDASKLPKDLFATLPQPQEVFENILYGSFLESERRRRGDCSSPGVFELLVYPSHLELSGPIDPNVSSMIDLSHGYIDNFMRVRFVDNTKKPLRTEHGINLDMIIEHRVVRMLNSGISPLLPAIGYSNKKISSRLQKRIIEGEPTPEFLGYTMSSLKKKKAVWFYVSSWKGAKELRDNIATWDEKDELNGGLAKKPSKWGARISLAFTESIPTIEIPRNEWERRKDYPANSQFPNTDGCGLISDGLCNAINTSLHRQGLAQSRAFQIRFGGVKGVVYAGAHSLLKHNDVDLKMLLRDSQVKIQVPNDSKLVLRIVSTASDSHSSLFFDAALKAFEDSGADTSKIRSIYCDTYEKLSTITSDTLPILKQIFRIPEDRSETKLKARYRLLKLALKLERRGIHPEDYQNSFLGLYLAKIAEKARYKNLFQIPIPGSYSLLGLTDDYQMLEASKLDKPCEVFIRARGQTIEGPVLIYRDPIIHIGDIQEAKAVSEETISTRMEKYADFEDRMRSLLCMENVVFFSQKDDPPFPNRLSGGDLDGDRFEILTKDCGFWGPEYKTYKPDNYTDEQPKSTRDKGPKNEIQSFDIRELANFIGNYIRNDCFSELQETLMCLADKDPDGLRSIRAQSLASWLSQAVDYPKNGKEVNLARDIFSNLDFAVTARPDFTRALSRKRFHDTSGEYYQSPNLLGQIYRHVVAIEYEVPKVIDNSGLKKCPTTRREEIESPIEMRAKCLLSPAMDIAVEEIVREERTRFLEYRDMQGLDDSTEIELFLQQRHSDFPNHLIDGLFIRIMAELQNKGVLIIVDTNYRNPVVRPEEGFDVNGMNLIFRAYLHKAWEIAIAFSSSQSGTGQGYAFICLYALWCEELNIEEGSA